MIRRSSWVCAFGPSLSSASWRYTRDYPLDSEQTLANTLDITREAFEVFSPKYVRVHLPAGQLEDRVIAGPQASTDFITLAGLVSDLQRLSPPPNMERVRLETARSTEFYNRYIATYEEFHRDVPRLRDLVLPTPLDKLELCISQGLLYEVYVDGQWAGLIGAREATDYVWGGYRVVEEILSSRFRGQGLGPAMQRRFIDKLPAGDREVLSGAIDPPNAPSQATAKRVGRVEIMHTRFVAL